MANKEILDNAVMIELFTYLEFDDFNALIRPKVTYDLSDDINLPLGTMRFRYKGGAGGHNGLKSITSYLGTDEYKRFRIGVGSPEIETDLADHVLSNFSAKEGKSLDKVISIANELLEIYLAEDFESMLNHYSKNKSAYSEDIPSLQDQSPKEVHI
jgi:PTH1 family peptidyl-tRNA hydrolase